MSAMKDCKFCDKRGLLWLPLIYAAIGNANTGLPKLSGKLGAGVTDLKLTQSSYSVRTLRPGFLYVLLLRAGIKYWNAYQVIDDAFLYKMDMQGPLDKPPEFSCERTTCGINASMVAIPDAKEVPQCWALFSPTVLTDAKLDEYKNNSDKFVAEGKMQTFSPAGWLAGNTAQ